MSRTAPPSVLAVFAVLLALSAAPLAAHPETAAPSAEGFLGDVDAQLKYVESQVVGLAQAVPAEKYPWRPAEGVRSYLEVCLHIAGGNYFLGSVLGTPPPDGIDSRAIEKSTTDKAKAIEAIQASFVHVRKVVAALTPGDLETKVDFFGEKPTKRRIVLEVLGHAHEHLGQSIAYARMNGVVPPWSK